VDVYVEIGSKKVFCGAIDWPGCERSAKTEDEALERFLSYGPRYAKAVNGFRPPRSLTVVEHLTGDMTTDFGAPSITPKADERPLASAQLKKFIGILEASWAYFDDTAERNARKSLTTGPRGGGRTVPKMIDHVWGADRGYLSAIGGSLPKGADLREMIVETLRKRVKGEQLPPTRRTKPLWTPRYFVRRSAWHALDHAWEIEDRAGR
jgi:hypothetical protein